MKLYKSTLKVMTYDKEKKIKGRVGGGHNLIQQDESSIYLESNNGRDRRIIVEFRTGRSWFQTKMSIIELIRASRGIQLYAQKKQSEGRTTY